MLLLAEVGMHEYGQDWLGGMGQTSSGWIQPGMHDFNPMFMHVTPSMLGLKCMFLGSENQCTRF